MGAAKSRGTKEQRIAEAIAALEETTNSGNKQFALTYQQQIQQHNIRVIREALLKCPADYV